MSRADTADPFARSGDEYDLANACLEDIYVGAYGYRDRIRETRAGIRARHPKLRKGSYFPRRIVEKTLTPMEQEGYV